MREAIRSLQFDTFLNVSGDAQVVKAVKACRRSASSPRLTSYRDDNGGPPAHVSGPPCGC